MYNIDKLVKKEKKIVKNNLDMIQDILEQKGFKVIKNINKDIDTLFLLNKFGVNYDDLIANLNYITYNMQLKYTVLSIEIANNTYLINVTDIYSIFC